MHVKIKEQNSLVLANTVIQKGHSFASIYSQWIFVLKWVKV